MLVLPLHPTMRELESNSSPNPKKESLRLDRVQMPRPGFLPLFLPPFVAPDFGDLEELFFDILNEAAPANQDGDVIVLD
jgi:hypothetical protein